MSLENFYAILAGIYFALTGLWWTVVEGRKDWLKDPEMCGLAGGVYASFLIPGIMSLGAQIGGDNKLVWRSVFVIAALSGLIFTTRLPARLRKAPQPGFFARSPLVGDLTLRPGVDPWHVSRTGRADWPDSYSG